MLEAVEPAVPAIPHDGRDGEQGRPPERRESPGATGPERPARQGAEPRVEVERASVGGACGKDAESEVEVAEIHRAGLRGRIAGGLAPETPEERRQRDLSRGAVDLAGDQRKEQQGEPLEQE